MNTKNSKGGKTERAAIGMAVGSLAIGLMVLWLAQYVLDSAESSVLIALIVLPLLVYLATSGKLSEFKGPGGIEAKFAQAAAESVSAASETVAYDDPQVVAKEGVRTLLERKAKEIDESKPIVMTMTIGGQAQYNPQDVEQYMNVLSQFRNFRFVVFTDDQEAFIAYMPSFALKQLLKVPDLASEFLSSVNQGQIAQVLRYPGVDKKTISTKSTNAEALREMLDKNIDALVIIDDARKLRGVVEREQVLSRMMLSLVR
jgi:CBS domain-containing protein